MRKSFDIALSPALALPLAAYMDAILAGTDGDGPPDPDYGNWARNCAGRLRSGDGEYVSLDEQDISMLAKDVLPEFLDTRIGTIERLVADDGDRDQMRLASGQMGSAVKLMARLHRVISFDMFDENRVVPHDNPNSPSTPGSRGRWWTGSGPPSRRPSRTSSRAG